MHRTATNHADAIVIEAAESHNILWLEGKNSRQIDSCAAKFLPPNRCRLS
ncbi:MAG: hypothetical protein ACREEL_14250 [Stellaceae bacterium]